ncbi:uncharacterized protein [Procambarus clarkii]|uniref:uncharacterized protein n=1 Tax=Procambarus clarkii TaxID=6728 RepID=UPI003744A355
MKSVCLLMFLCVSLVNAEDSVTGSASGPAGTPPPASNGAAAGGSTFDPPQRFHDSSESHESHEFIPGCVKTAACIAASGKCQSAPCTVQQKRVHGGCTGSVCNCCAPRGCDPQPKCKKSGGFCALACGPGLQVLPGGCTGTCSCCARPCGTSDECEDWHGVCQRQRCAPGQRELLDACPGQGCRCCSPAGPIRNVESNSTIGEVINVETGEEGSDVTQSNEEEEEEDEEEEDEDESVDSN